MFDIGFRLNGSEKRAQRIPIATPQEEARDKWRRNSSDIEIDSRGYWKEDKEKAIAFPTSGRSANELKTGEHETRERVNIVIESPREWL